MNASYCLPLFELYFTGRYPLLESSDEKDQLTYFRCRRFQARKSVLYGEEAEEAEEGEQARPLVGR